MRNGDIGVLDVGPGVVREPNGKPRVVDALAMSPNQLVELTGRITDGMSGSIGATPTLRLEFTGDRLSIEPLDGKPWRLTSPDGRSGAAWLVHTGPAERLHRIVRFDLQRGSSR